MFFSKFDPEEIIKKTADNLYLANNRDKIAYLKKKAAIIRHLETASNTLDELGFEKEAEVLTNLMSKMAEDPKDSIGKKMLSDLEHSGFVLETAAKQSDRDLNLSFDVSLDPVDDANSADDMLKNLPQQSFSGHV